MSVVDVIYAVVDALNQPAPVATVLAEPTLVLVIPRGATVIDRLVVSLSALEAVQYTRTHWHYTLTTEIVRVRNYNVDTDIDVVLSDMQRVIERLASQQKLVRSGNEYLLRDITTGESVYNAESTIGDLAVITARTQVSYIVAETLS
jgi:hypothetical protein